MEFAKEGKKRSLFKVTLQMSDPAFDNHIKQLMLLKRLEAQKKRDTELHQIRT